MTISIMSKEKLILDFWDIVIGVGSFLGTAAGLKLLKLAAKYTKEKRNQLRDEWREDLVTQNTELKAQVKQYTSKLEKVSEHNTNLRIENSVLKQRFITTKKHAN